MFFVILVLRKYSIIDYIKLKKKHNRLIKSSKTIVHKTECTHQTIQTIYDGNNFTK